MKENMDTESTKSIETSAVNSDPNLALTTVPESVRDFLEIADAVYRFGAGIDLNDARLLASAFADDAVVDFSASARHLNIELPQLTGRENIVEFLITNAGPQTTTHAVTNPRVRIDGNQAKMLALVEAVHLPPDDHSRQCLMRNRYDVDLTRDDERWLIRRLTIDTAWFRGDPQVLLGK